MRCCIKRNNENPPGIVKNIKVKNENPRATGKQGKSTDVRKHVHMNKIVPVTKLRQGYVDTQLDSHRNPTVSFLADKGVPVTACCSHMPHTPINKQNETKTDRQKHPLLTQDGRLSFAAFDKLLIWGWYLRYRWTGTAGGIVTDGTAVFADNHLTHLDAGFVVAILATVFGAVRAVQTLV